MKKLITLIIVLVVIAGGIYLYGNSLKNVGPADWQTYKNEKYGFEFKYPADKVDVDEREGVIYVGAVAPLITINPKDGYVEINNGLSISIGISRGAYYSGSANETLDTAKAILSTFKFTK